MTAWLRETVTSSRKMSLAGERPIVTGPRVEREDLAGGAAPERTASVGPSIGRPPCHTPASTSSSLIANGPVISSVPWPSTISSAPQRPQYLWASL